MTVDGHDTRIPFPAFVSQLRHSDSIQVATLPVNALMLADELPVNGDLWTTILASFISR